MHVVGGSCGREHIVGRKRLIVAAFRSLRQIWSDQPRKNQNQSLGSQPPDLKTQPQRIGIGLVSLASIGYIWSVGYFSDDFSYLQYQAAQDSVWGALTPNNSFISLILEQYTHVFSLYFSSLESAWLPQILKTLYVIACLYMCGRFFSLFMPPALGQVASFLFVFFPTHESTVYWYLGQYLMLTISLYFYAYYLTRRQAFSLAVVFGPNLLYTVYYVITSEVMGLGIQRLNDSAPIVLFRQFIFQILTFIDATIGPSIWMKLFYGLGELTILSAVLTLVGLGVFWRTCSLKASLLAFRGDRDLV